MDDIQTLDNHQNNNNNNNQSSDITFEKLQEDLDQAMNNWKRTAADFDNFKKQKERENKELIEFAREVVVVRLLPTLDALGQALRHAPEFSDHLDTMKTGKLALMAL